MEAQAQMAAERSPAASLPAAKVFPALPVLLREMEVLRDRVVADMLRHGMDCARINCTHDAPEALDALKVLGGILTRMADHRKKMVSRLRALGCWRMA